LTQIDFVLATITTISSSNYAIKKVDLSFRNTNTKITQESNSDRTRHRIN